ncbi:baseplate J/gp47 family protein [Clostridium aciditolerans]|uniref:Baseplate J/gp47 family protein n=1 Tax=Clostridium aciditolerans TaxID=339861 RepID=A0A934HUV3_9CLOT|nr:baseplate J/gp47 family protein [Clostridium aciditolerans]MBI6873738.1 baseplate J/gp47 family protein [Clostridium aciditolerans]
MYSENNSTNDILKRMRDGIPSDIDKSEGSFIYDSLLPAANEFQKAHIKLDNVARKLSIEALSGDELEQRIYEKTGIKRKEATKAHTTLNVIGNATIKAGDLFQTAGGIQFISIETKTIVTKGTISIEAVVPGISSNVPANQITVIPVVIPGIISVNNPSTTEGGYDAESDEELIKRYYERIRTPATSNNKAQYKNWAKEIEGVGDAKVYSLWNGDNTVKVVIIDSNKQPASTELVQAVQNYIDPGSKGLGDGAAAIGAFCTVASAVGKAINVCFTAVKDKNYTDEQRKINFENNLIDFLKNFAFVESSISYAKVGALILDTKGFLDYSNLTINGGTSNILIDDNEVAVKGVVTIE